MDVLIKIWSPDHLQNHAVSLRENLMQMSYNVVVTPGVLYGDDTLYILYCPQVLPEYCWDISRIKNYIVYHTEHAERFLIGNENRRMFENAKAIWCHTPETIAEFYKYYPHIKCELVPPGLVVVPLAKPNKNIDVIFYGNISERRKNILDLLTNNGINVNIVTNLFGVDLLLMLLHSRIVLNLHYASPAPLELFRIHEGLSAGCHVISEWSALEGFKIDYRTIVHFMDDPYKMILWIQHLLIHQIRPNFDVTKLDNRSYLEEALKKLKT